MKTVLFRIILLLIIILSSCSSETDRAFREAEKVVSKGGNATLLQINSVLSDLKKVFNENADLKKDKSNIDLYNQVVNLLNLKNVEVAYTDIKNKYAGELGLFPTTSLYNYYYELDTPLALLENDSELYSKIMTNKETIENEINKRYIDIQPDSIYIKRWELSTIGYKNFIQELEGKVVHWKGYVADVNILEDTGFKTLAGFNNRPFIVFNPEEHGIHYNVFIYGNDEQITNLDIYTDIEVVGVIYKIYELLDMTIYIDATDIKIVK